MAGSVSIQVKLKVGVSGEGMNKGVGGGERNQNKCHRTHTKLASNIDRTNIYLGIVGALLTFVEMFTVAHHRVNTRKG